MPNDKLAGSRTEMKCLNAPQDDDSCSSNSNDFAYSDFPKKIPLNGQYPDADAESQNFLSDHNPNKKKYETEYVSSGLFIPQCISLVVVCISSVESCRPLSREAAY
uniref:Uncharacterized protein n=1 Tax=Xiphophorus couchianus TaxID=32473 RepID=A0A3B5MLM4_9TELE